MSIKLSPQINFQLIVTFTNGEVPQFDVKPYLDKGIFIELKDSAYFQSVRAVAGVLNGPINRTSV
jgi:hypothetical protein